MGGDPISEYSDGAGCKAIENLCWTVTQGIGVYRGRRSGTESCSFAGPGSRHPIWIMYSLLRLEVIVEADDGIGMCDEGEQAWINVGW